MTIKNFLTAVFCFSIAILSLNRAEAQDIDFDNLRLGMFGDVGELEPELTFMTQSGSPHIMTFKQTQKGLGLLVNSLSPSLFVHDNAAKEAMSIGELGVGIGTLSPESAFHVLTDNSTASFEPGGFAEAKIVVENRDEGPPIRTMFELINNGACRFAFRNSITQEEWAFLTNANDDFVISRAGTGGGEMIMRKDGAFMVGPGADNSMYLDIDGSMYLMGTLYELSDKNAKKNFQPVDAEAILQKVSKLSIQTWQYKDDKHSSRHMGPMAQDFRSTFGLGKDEKSIASVDTTGVAFAAIQALNDKLESKDKLIANLEDRTQMLEDQLAELKALVAQSR